MTGIAVSVPRFGGQRGSAAATGPRATSGIFVLMTVFMVSMNLLATTAYPVFVGWMPSSEKKPPRKLVVPVYPLIVRPEAETCLKRALISIRVAFAAWAWVAITWLNAVTWACTLTTSAAES